MAGYHYKDMPIDMLTEEVHAIIKQLTDAHKDGLFSQMQIMEKLYYLAGEVLPPKEERTKSDGPYHSLYNRVWSVIRDGYDEGLFDRVKRGVYRIAEEDKMELSEPTPEPAPEPDLELPVVQTGDVPLVLSIELSNGTVHVAKGSDGHLYRVEFTRL